MAWGESHTGHHPGQRCVVTGITQAVAGGSKLEPLGLGYCQEPQSFEGRGSDAGTTWDYDG